MINVHMQTAIKTRQTMPTKQTAQRADDNTTKTNAMTITSTPSSTQQAGNKHKNKLRQVGMPAWPHSKTIDTC
jgi:hypothetical protein